MTQLSPPSWDLWIQINFSNFFKAVTTVVGWRVVLKSKWLCFPGCPQPLLIQLCGSPWARGSLTWRLPAPLHRQHAWPHVHVSQASVSLVKWTAKTLYSTVDTACKVHLALRVKLAKINLFTTKTQDHHGACLGREMSSHKTIKKGQWNKAKRTETLRRWEKASTLLHSWHVCKGGWSQVFLLACTTHVQSGGFYILTRAEVWTKHHRGEEMPLTPARQMQRTGKDLCGCFAMSNYIYHDQL